MKLQLILITLLALFSLNVYPQTTKIKKQKTAEFTVSKENEVIKFDAWVWKKPLRISPSTGKMYHWYKSNTIMSTNGGIDGKVLHGKYAAFYLNNNLKEKGRIKKGLKCGEWKAWYDNGNIKEIASWKKGSKTGGYALYSEDGKLLEKGKLKNGIRHGFIKSYAADTVSSLIRFKNGVPQLEVEVGKSKKDGKHLKEQKEEGSKGDGEKTSKIFSLKKSKEEKAKDSDNKKKEKAKNSEKKPFSEKLKGIFKKKEKPLETPKK